MHACYAIPTQPEVTYLPDNSCKLTKNPTPRAEYPCVELQQTKERSSENSVVPQPLQLRPPIHTPTSPYLHLKRLPWTLHTIENERAKYGHKFGHIIKEKIFLK